MYRGVVVNLSRNIMFCSLAPRNKALLENTRETGWPEGPFVLRNIVHPNALFKQNISSTNNELLDSNMPIDAKNIDDC